MSANLKKLTVPELKKQLVASGLSVTGRKADLVQRLCEMEKEGHPDDAEGSVEGGKGDGGKSAGLPKKGKESGRSKKGLTKKEKPKCVESCKPGRNSRCPIKTKGRGKTSNNVGCADIDKMLEALGVDAKNASLCTKAAIMRGHIEITGEKGDLEKVVLKDKGFFCGHMVEATLGDLLKQPDYAWPDYELKNATVICKTCGVDNEDGRNYVSNICEGEPRFDDGKFHNHCTKCPGFGKCIDDYRERHCDRCGRHYFAGSSGQFPCENCQRKNREAF